MIEGKTRAGGLLKIIASGRGAEAGGDARQGVTANTTRRDPAVENRQWKSTGLSEAL
jgi:hypothetical protein